MRNSLVHILNIGGLVFSVALMLLSFWKTVINSEYVPYLPLLAGSMLSALMFLALNIGGTVKRTAVAWSVIAWLNTAMLFLFYVFPTLLKELYSVHLWITLTVIIVSLQSLLERKKKRFHTQMKFINIGLVMLLLPLLMLKPIYPWVWSAMSWTTMVVMMANLILFVVPSEKSH